MTRSVGYLALLRDHADYRRLFAARSVSLLGDWFSLIAIVALLREVRGSSPTALSGVLILRLLPMFLAGPLAGVVADRFSRRTVMLTSDVIRGLLALGLLAAPATAAPVATVYLLTALQVVASAFFEPARAAALPQLVPANALSTANALGAMVWSVMFAAGSALGGIVTDLAGWRAALLVDAGTYVVSAAILIRMRLPARERPPDRRLDWRTLTGWRDFRAGVGFIVRRPSVATVIGLKAGWGVAGAATLLLTLLGERIYMLGGRADWGVALMFCARAVGTGVGPLLARRFVTDESPRTMRRLLGAAFVWPAFWYVVFSVTREPVTAAACVVLAHFGGSIVWVYSTVLLQRMVPDDFRGRVMSTDLGLATMTISASTWIYGLLAAAPGADLQVLIRWMGLSLLVPAAFWMWAAGRSSRSGA